MTTYLFAGGGTAGHVNPLLATADKLCERDPDAQVIVLGTAEGLEARLVPQRGYELVTIPRVPFPRRLNGAALRFPARALATVRQVRRLIRDRHVDAVVGFGGYVAGPAYLAAGQAHVPLVVHETNAKPGMANRLGARLTRSVGVVFPSTKLPHARVVGLPLRREIEQLDVPSARTAAITEFGLVPGRPLLLVTGGSTGARQLNQAISGAIHPILDAGWQVLHLTGSKAPVEDPHLVGYRIQEYSDRMELALAAADFAVSRAGGTLAELAVLGVPAVLVPYAVGNGEQRFNAQDAVDAGGAIVVDDSAFTAAWVVENLVPLLGDHDRIAAMAQGMASIGVRDGADRTVELVLAAVQESGGHRR